MGHPNGQSYDSINGGGVVMQAWILSNQKSLIYVLPELFLLGYGVMLLLLSLLKWNKKDWILVLSIVGFVIAQVLSFKTFDFRTQYLFADLMKLDAFVFFARVFFYLTSLITCFFMFQSKTFEKPKRLLEALAFLYIVSVGLVWMSMSVDILMTILTLEMVSILSYLLVSSKPRDVFSSEAGLKYLLFGAVASGIMFYGFSFIYGLTGTTSYVGMTALMTGQTEIAIVLFFSMVCILVGMGFKMNIFPTQMWSPDVYQGAPTSITAFLSVCSMSAGFLVWIRWLTELHVYTADFGAFIAQIRLFDILSLFAVLSMFIGNVSALKQKSLKRMMAYSSIAHAGFILLGLTTFSQSGLQAVLFYLCIYALMNFGAFFMIHIRILDTQHDHIDAFRGYGNQDITMAVCMSLFLLSLIGLPPFSGFIAKFYIFSSLIEHELYMLAIFGAINTAIAIYYYMKIIKWMFFKEGNDPVAPKYTVLTRVFVWSLAIPVVLLGVYWEPLLGWIQRSVSGMFY